LYTTEDQGTVSEGEPVFLLDPAGSENQSRFIARRAGRRGAGVLLHEIDD